MSGTITQSHSKPGKVGVITFTCTADAADGSFPQTNITDAIEGELLQLETNPGATAPTANYDIVLNDDQGADVLMGVGANRHTSTTEIAGIVFSGTSYHPYVDKTQTLTLVITNNSVNSAGIVVKLYYRKL